MKQTLFNPICDLKMTNEKKKTTLVLLCGRGLIVESEPTKLLHDIKLQIVLFQTSKGSNQITSQMYSC